MSEYTSIAVKWSTKDKIKSIRRELRKAEGDDISYDDTISHLLLNQKVN